MNIDKPLKKYDSRADKNSYYIDLICQNCGRVPPFDGSSSWIKCECGTSYPVWLRNKYQDHRSKWMRTLLEREDRCLNEIQCISTYLSQLTSIDSQDVKKYIDLYEQRLRLLNDKLKVIHADMKHWCIYPLGNGHLKS